MLGDLLKGYVDKLLTFPDVGQCADWLLSVAVKASEDAFRGAARPSRFSIHLRDDSGYKELLARIPGRNGWIDDDLYDAVSSSTLWYWVTKTLKPFQVTLLSGRILVLERTTVEGVERSLSRTDRQLPDRATIRLISSRGTTHLLVFPIVANGARVLGMLVVEIAADPALEHAFWRPEFGSISELLRLAAPWIASLPARCDGAKDLDGNPQQEHPDPLMPVIGSFLRLRLPMLRAFAAQHDHILLTGASGTGKTRLAAWCHANSRAAKGPFEVVDFHAIPKDTQLAELVGWRKGAFTGATDHHAGALDRPQDGTLLIDEVEKLSLDVQAGLLRILESGEYRPLGDHGGPKVSNARIVVGTNADLKDLVLRGHFREDLYYRINVLSFRLPTLAERRDEIPAWVDYMLGQVHAESGESGSVVVGKAALDRLVMRPWPGNLRQLNNTLRRSYAIAVAERRNPMDDLVVDSRHVEWAFELDPVGEPAETFSAGLSRSADHFIDLALNGERDSVAFSLDHAEAFKGFVLARAMLNFDLNPDDVYRLFGKGDAVLYRNHKRQIRSELKKTSRLLRQMGEVESAKQIERLYSDLS